MDHADPERLAVYADRRLPPAEGAALEGHLADCPDCLGEFLVLRRELPAEAPPARHWIPLAAAAAAALLAVFLLPWRKAEPPAKPSEAPQRVVGMWVEGGSHTLPGMRLVLDRGRAQVLEGGGLALASGRLWLDAASETLVRFPGGELRCADAEVAVVLPEAPKAAWVKDAEAAEAAVEIVCRRGSCRVLWKELEREVPALTLLRLDSIAETKPLSDAEADRLVAWRWGSGRPASLEGAHLKHEDGFGSRPLSRMPSGDWRLEMSVRPRRPGGDFGLAFPALGSCPYWVIGANGDPLPAERWTRLAAAREGRRVLLWRDDMLTATLDVSAADAMTPAEDLPSVGLWGAEVDLKDVRIWEEGS